MGTVSLTIAVVIVIVCLVGLYIVVILNNKYSDEKISEDILDTLKIEALTEEDELLAQLNEADEPPKESSISYVLKLHYKDKTILTWTWTYTGESDIHKYPDDDKIGPFKEFREWLLNSDTSYYEIVSDTDSTIVSRSEITKVVLFREVK